MSKKTAIILISVIIAAFAGFVVFMAITQPENLKENAPRIGIIGLGFVATLYKVIVKNGVSSGGLSFYEKRYHNEIKDAFSYEKKKRNKLLTSLKYFNEGKYEKMRELLEELYKAAKNSEERSVCGLFIGLSYSESGYTEKAIEQYEKLVEMRLENESICNNLGLLYKENGRFDKAMELFEMALKINPEYAVIYNNMAGVRFDEGDFDEAIKLSETALSKDVKLNYASDLLAIIYYIKDDKENSDKYYRMSVANGSDGSKLKLAMKYYKDKHEEAADI